MRWHVLALFAFLPAFANANDEASWSSPVNGLRGRLIIPANQKRDEDPFIHVYLELQNTQNVLGDRKFRYKEDCFSPRVTDESGKPFSGTPIAVYDGWTQNHESIVLPFDSTLRFRIDCHGMFVGPGTERNLDFGPTHSWFIPVADGHTYFLSGILTLPQILGEDEIKNWSGILKLPRIPIPQE